MSNVTITTNNVPRPVLDWSDLNANERAEFDYIDDPECAIARFVRYKGVTYDLHEFQVTTTLNDAAPLYGLREWSGYQPDSFFSGVLVRYVDPGVLEDVVMGTYYVR